LRIGLFDDAQFEIKAAKFEPTDLLIIFSNDNNGATKVGGKEVGVSALPNVSLRALAETLVVRSRDSSAGCTRFQRENHRRVTWPPSCFG